MNDLGICRTADKFFYRSPLKKLISMIALTLTLTLTFAFSTGMAFAQTAASAHQGKMASCNKDATGKKGAERQIFMKECLSTQARFPKRKTPAPRWRYARPATIGLVTTLA